MKKRVLILEMIGIFVIPPILVMFGMIPKYAIMPLLWIGALYGYLIIRPHLSLKELFSFHTDEFRSILKRFLMLGTLLGSFVALFYPDFLFSLIIEKPTVWLTIILLYPLLSALLQEILFRGFFVHRYNFLLQNERSLIVLNATLFGYVHMLFGNLLAVGLSFLGGLLFMRTYLKTRSILMSSIEHALYGNLIFTLGIGIFFYHGA